MKYFIVLAALSLATHTSAQTERNIYDLLYLPKAGTTFGITEYSYQESKTKYSFFGDALTNFGNSVSQTVGYSLTDRLYLAASMTYINFGSLDGVSDPVISGRFRVLDEGLKLDVIGGALVSFGDAKSSDVKRGGHVLFAGVQLGGQADAFQWAAIAQFTHYLEATSETSTGDEKEEAYNGFSLGGDVLLRLAEKSNLRPSLGVNFSEGHDDDGGFTYAATTTYSAGLEYQQVFSRDFMARVGLDYNDRQRDSGNIEYSHSYVYSVGLNYQF